MNILILFAIYVWSFMQFYSLHALLHHCTPLHTYIIICPIATDGDVCRLNAFNGMYNHAV